MDFSDGLRVLTSKMIHIYWENPCIKYNSTNGELWAYWAGSSCSGWCFQLSSLEVHGISQLP